VVLQVTIEYNVLVIILKGEVSDMFNGVLGEWNL